MKLVVALCFFPIFFACASLPESTLPLPESIRTAAKSALAAPVRDNTYVAAHQVAIDKYLKKLQVRSFSVLKIGRRSGDYFPIRVRPNAKLTVVVMTKNVSKMMSMKQLLPEYVDGKLMVRLPLEEVQAGALLLIKKVEVVANRKELFFRFYPASGRGALFSQLSINIGKRLNYAFSPVLEDGLQYSVAKTQYKWRFEDTDEISGDIPPFLYITTQTNIPRLLNGLLREYKSAIKRVFIRKGSSPLLLQGVKGGWSRLSYLHEYYLAAADSLEPGLFPGGSAAIRSAADYCAHLLAMLKKFGYKAALVVPYSIVQGRAALDSSPGVVVYNKKKRYWHFPDSRFAAVGDIPSRLRGKRCFLLHMDGDIERSVIPRQIKSKNYSTIYLTLYPRKNGSCYLYGTLVFSGAPALLWRRAINSATDYGEKRAFLGNLFGEGLSFYPVRFQVKHRRILRHPLRISFSGTLYGAIRKKGRLNQLDLSLLKYLLRKKGVIGYSMREQVRVYLPHRAVLYRRPRKLRTTRNGVYLRSKSRYVRGRRIRKPRHWSWRLWRRWLRYNVSKRKDYINYSFIILNKYKAGISRRKYLTRLLARNSYISWRQR